MCKEHTTKLKVNSAVRTLGRTEVGISATPEHVSCTPCRQFASIAGLFSAVRVVLDGDRKSTRLNSSHLVISYAVFCLKKKKNSHQQPHTLHTIHSSKYRS